MILEVDRGLSGDGNLLSGLQMITVVHFRLLGRHTKLVCWLLILEAVWWYLDKDAATPSQPEQVSSWH